MTSRRHFLGATAALSLLPAFARGASPVAAAAVPDAGAWRARASIPWVVQEVYGVARGGRAVIVGGMVRPGERALAIDAVGLYDPVADRWDAGPSLPEPRHHPMVATVGTRLYAFGGATHVEAGHWSPRADVFVEQDGAWQRATPMPQLQTEGVALVHEGRVHIVGGRLPTKADAALWGDYRDVALHQVYDTDRDRWSTAAPLPGPRNSATGAVIDGVGYVAGGRTMDGGNLADLLRYDFVADRWDALQPMPEAAGGLAGVALGGQLYVFGGEALDVEGAEGVIANAWRYDPLRDTWTALPDMRTPRHGLAAVALNGSIYAIGGGVETANTATSDIVEVFTPTG